MELIAFPAQAQGVLSFLTHFEEECRERPEWINDIADDSEEQGIKLVRLTQRTFERMHAESEPGGGSVRLAEGKRKYQHSASWKPKARVFHDQVRETFSTFRKLFCELRQARKAAPLESAAWTNHLRQQNYSDAEIDAALHSKTLRAAAIRCAAIREGLKLKTAQNLYYAGALEKKSLEK